MRVTLVSTYELGRQPFGLASAAAWARDAGASITCCDLAVEPLDLEAVAAADLIAFYVPMHTATRLAADLATRVKALNPSAHLCFFGLYASVNEQYLRSLGGDTILGGEFEEGLRSLVARLSATGGKETPGLDPSPGGPPQADQAQAGPPQADQAQAGPPQADQAQADPPHADPPQADPPHADPPQLEPAQADPPQLEPVVSLARQRFLVPDRSSLPSLDRYAYLTTADGLRRTVGYTEATRGCKHLCRHCPVVPVYEGRFRVVQREVVLDDVANQVAAGAQHITFGDPDFLNGPAHALAVVDALHERFPELSYDVTIKVEHLVKHADLLPRLRATGCTLVTTAVESFDEHILDIFDKRHTKADVAGVVGLLRDAGIGFNPTFVTFTPWTTRKGYLHFLDTLVELDLVANVSPVQYAIRLLIPDGSKLLDLASVRELVAGEFDAEKLSYTWRHPDPGMDELHERVAAAVQVAVSHGKTRREVFATVARLACDGRHPSLATDHDHRPLVPVGAGDGPSSWPVPYLSEPWYC